MIDFDKYEEDQNIAYDENVFIGLTNIHQFLKDIYEQSEHYEVELKKT